jgi:hypothetical protein
MSISISCSNCAPLQVAELADVDECSKAARSALAHRIARLGPARHRDRLEALAVVLLEHAAIR